MEPKKIISGVVLLVLILSILIVIYLTVRKIYNPFNTGVIIVDKPVQLTKDMLPCDSELPEGVDHTYSFWAYVSHWDLTPGRPKYIFRRAHDPYNLNVSIGGDDADLEIFLTDKNGQKVARKNHMKYFSQNQSDTKQFVRSADNDHTHVFHNFPLQSWVHVTISIYDKTLDMYINGKLVRTFILAEELQPGGNGEIVIGSLEDDAILSGFISKFRYYPRVISPDEVYKLYLAGPASASDLADESGKQKLTLSMSYNSGPSCASAE